MIQLPPTLIAKYRPDTDQEVRSWSFRRLTARRPPAADWEQQRGTLDDQAIFGSLQNHECACGKYQGQRYAGMICDRCGVKLTTAEQRRRRFAHIDLTSPVPHPCGEIDLSAVPVLPAAFVNSEAGGRLALLYDHMVCVAAAEALQQAGRSLEELLGLLLPVVVMAEAWGLQESVTLARGDGVGTPRGAPGGPLLRMRVSADRPRHSCVPGLRQAAPSTMTPGGPAIRPTPVVP
jgi:hypothetical protein